MKNFTLTTRQFSNYGMQTESDTPILEVGSSSGMQLESLKSWMPKMIEAQAHFYLTALCMANEPYVRTQNNGAQNIFLTKQALYEDIAFFGNGNWRVYDADEQMARLNASHRNLESFLEMVHNTDSSVYFLGAKEFECIPKNHQIHREEVFFSGGIYTNSSEFPVQSIAEAAIQEDNKCYVESRGFQREDSEFFSSFFHDYQEKSPSKMAETIEQFIAQGGLLMKLKMCNQSENMWTHQRSWKKNHHGNHRGVQQIYASCAVVGSVDQAQRALTIRFQRGEDKK